MSLCSVVCEMTRAFTNKVKPPTHKCISARALEEITGNKGKARGSPSSVPVILEREVPIPPMAAILALLF